MNTFGEKLRFTSFFFFFDVDVGGVLDGYPGRIFVDVSFIHK